MRQPAPDGPNTSADAGLRRDFASRLIAEQPRTLVGHLALLALTIATLWSEAPHALLLTWAAVIVAATTARGLLWLRSKADPAPEERLTALRLITAVVALAWGAGGVALIPHLSPTFLALLLLTLCGLSAVATSTLAADLVGFRLFVVCTLGPQPIIILLQGIDRFHLAAAGLIVLGGGFFLQLHLATYRGLVARTRGAAELERSFRETRQEHLFLDALFASVPNAIVIVDKTGVCLGANPGFEDLYGFPLEESLGRSLFELIVPASRQEEAVRHQQRVLRGEAIVAETERRRKDGTLVAVRLSAAQVAGDEEGRLLLLYTDITATRNAAAAMRAAQTRLEHVLASSTAVIYATRVEGLTFTPSWVSENLTRITGYKVAEALVPDWWHSHVHPDDYARVLAELPRLLAEDYLTVEYRFQQKDGSFRWLRDESRLIRDAAGQPEEVFGTWLDITDLKLAEKTMRVGRDLAEEAARSRSEFLANMSHEIRTPMNAVLGLTDLLLDTELTAEQRRFLMLVQSAGVTLLALLNDILDLSKIEAERMPLEAIPFDLRYLLESTVSLFAVRATDRSVDLMADVAGEVPHQVLGDPTRLRQVLSNLISNALKFTDRGEVVLSAAVTSIAEGRSVIRFAVRDTGIGIAPDKQAAIFEQFSQADPSTTRKYGGTGLGLTIAQRLVRLMGGQLSLTSEVGQGAEFYFSLPLDVQAERPTAGPSAPDMAGRRVLVVDDSATIRRIAAEMLSSAQVTVDGAATAGEGLAALRRASQDGQPYSLALIDAQMFDRDGFDLAAEIRGDRSIADTVRLLMLTSAGQRGDTQRCRELGIEGYLMKPLSRSDLLEAASALLRAGERTPHVDMVTRHSMAESRARLRILLAEDNTVNQEVAATMLRRRGHTVSVVNNGREAVDAVAAGGPFDIVLMDIQMPELDGYGATREIRAGPAGAELPIIALSAHVLTAERERCLKQGMNGYVPKPFRPHELFAAVEGFGWRATAPTQLPRPVSGAVDLEGFRSTMREVGAEEAVDGILDLFSEEAPSRLRALAAAVKAGDGPAIGQAAHAFKSPAGTIGAHALQTLLNGMEAAGMAGEIRRACAALPQLESEAAAVLECLRRHRAESKHA